MSAKLVRVVEFANHEHYVYSCVDCGTEYIRSVKGKHINPYCADCSRKYQKIRANEQKAKRQEEHDKQIRADVIESAYYIIKPFMSIEEWTEEVNRQIELKEQTE